MLIAISKLSQACEIRSLDKDCQLLIISFWSNLSRAVHIDDALTARTAKARVAFGSLRGNVWDRSEIRLDTNLKLKSYKDVILPTLLYANVT